MTFDFPVMVSISARAVDLESHREVVFDRFLEFWGSFSTAIEKEETAGKYPLSVFLVIKYRHENSAPSFWNIFKRPMGSFLKPSERMNVIETIRQLLTTKEYETYALPELCGADCDDVDAWIDTDPVIDWMKRKNIVRKDALERIFSDNLQKRIFIESLAPRLKREIGLAEA